MIKTKNIYFAAYLLTEEIPFVGTEVLNDIGNKTGVIFSFKPQTSLDEELIQTSYEDGIALVNIRKYLDQLVLVRETMYHEIEKKKSGKRKLRIEEPKKRTIGKQNEYSKTPRIKTSH